MDTPPQTSKETPKEDFSAGIWTMYFRHHTNHLVSKNFRHHGDLRSARERAEKHCNTIGAKLNFVQPFLSDLQKEEDYSLGRGAAAPSSEVLAGIAVK
jgi:hypothetical protein